MGDVVKSYYKPVHGQRVAMSYEKGLKLKHELVIYALCGPARGRCLCGYWKKSPPKGMLILQQRDWLVREWRQHCLLIKGARRDAKRRMLPFLGPSPRRWWGWDRGRGAGPVAAP